MGIHIGEAELLEDGQYQGYLTLNLVRRIIPAAHGGQIFVSQVVYDLTHKMLSPDIKPRDVGEHRFKDCPQIEEFIS